MNLGFWEISLILLLAMFLFGAKRIPVIARGLGESIRNFKGELRRSDSPPSDRTLEEPPENDRP